MNNDSTVPSTSPDTGPTADPTDPTADPSGDPSGPTTTSRPPPVRGGRRSATRPVELTNGQVLAFEDFGATEPDAPVVLFLHSSPGSRLLDPDPGATAAAGVRLVTVDRPGYGASSPWPVGTVPNLVEGAEWIAEGLGLLGIEQVAVVGWSAGGRAALALAALYPTLVQRVALVGAPAPDDEVAWLSDEHRQLGMTMRADPPEAMPTIIGVFSGSEPSAGAPSEQDMISMVAGGPGDDAVLADATKREALLDMLRESFAQGPGGVATDIVADHVAPWGFELSSVVAPVAAFYSDLDTIVGPEHGSWYVEQVQNGTERPVSGVGHLLVLTEWADILESVLDPVLDQPA